MFNFTCIVSSFPSGPRETPTPEPILNNPCSRLSYIYVTTNLIKLIFAIMITTFHFLLQFASIKVRYVNFRTNLSLQSKSNVGQTYPSHLQLLCFYKLSYLALFELDFVIFMVDDSMQLPIPNIQTLI